MDQSWLSRGSVHPIDDTIVHVGCLRPFHHNRATSKPCDSSIPRKRRPADTNSDVGMTLEDSTGFVLKTAVASGPGWLLYRTFAKPLTSFFPFGQPVPRGGIASGSCSRHATYLSYHTRFCSFLSVNLALLELVVLGSSAVSTSANHCPNVSCSPGRKAQSRQLPDMMFVMVS